MQLVVSASLSVRRPRDRGLLSACDCGSDADLIGFIPFRHDAAVASYGFVRGRCLVNERKKSVRKPPACRRRLQGRHRRVCCSGDVRRSSLLWCCERLKSESVTCGQRLVLGISPTNIVANGMHVPLKIAGITPVPGQPPTSPIRAERRKVMPCETDSI
jgi:hypothetical protein